MWLISPQPLPGVSDGQDATVNAAGTSPDLWTDNRADCECEDLNGAFSDAVFEDSPKAGLTMATARRLRRLHDIEAAALATASVLLGRLDPEVLAAARVRVAPEVATVATASSTHGGGPRVRPGVVARLGREVAVAGGLCAAAAERERFDDIEMTVVSLGAPVRLGVGRWRVRSSSGAVTGSSLVRVERR